MPVNESASIRRLFEVIAAIDSPEECAHFFNDLCTIKEIADMAQRLDTVILLDRGVAYQQISRELGVSTTTVTRVNRSLKYGEGGYQAVLARLKNKPKNDD